MLYLHLKPSLQFDFFVSDMFALKYSTLPAVLYYFYYLLLPFIFTCTVHTIHRDIGSNHQIFLIKYMFLCVTVLLTICIFILLTIYMVTDHISSCLLNVVISTFIGVPQTLQEYWSSNITGVLVLKHYRSTGPQTLQEYWSSNITGLLVLKHHRNICSRTLKEYWFLNMKGILVLKLYYSWPIIVHSCSSSNCISDGLQTIRDCWQSRPRIIGDPRQIHKMEAPRILNRARIWKPWANAWC